MTIVVGALGLSTDVAALGQQWAAAGGRGVSISRPLP
jgi:hypothetical protein